MFVAILLLRAERAEDAVGATAVGATREDAIGCLRDAAVGIGLVEDADADWFETQMAEDTHPQFALHVSEV